MNTITEFKTIKGLVLTLLEKEERCRNDDNYLTYRVFEIIARKHGFNGIFIPFSIWEEFPAFETIKRTRAKIQNRDKMFLPTNEATRRRRRQREQDVRALFGEDSL